VLQSQWIYARCIRKCSSKFKVEKLKLARVDLFNFEL
jgi:hypothetical protein